MYRFIVVASLAIDVLRRDRLIKGRNYLPMVSFSRTHFRISLRRPCARGSYRLKGHIYQRAYWPQGGVMAPVALSLATPLNTEVRRVGLSEKRSIWLVGR